MSSGASAVRAGRPARRYPLALNLGASIGAQLLKLRVEGLPVGADAGIADEAGSRQVSIISYGNPKPLIARG